MTASRALTFLLGLWLFLSSFLWPHGAAQLTNALITGVIIMVLSLLVLAGFTRMRYANAIVAVWLFFATLMLPDLRLGLMWNNCLVAMAVFVISMVPAELEHPGRRYRNRYQRGG